MNKRLRGICIGILIIVLVVFMHTLEYRELTSLVN